MQSLKKHIINKLRTENGKPNTRIILVCAALFVLNVVFTAVFISSSLRDSFLLVTLGLVTAWITCSLAIIFAAALIGIFASTENILAKLRLIIEHEHYTSRIEENSNNVMIDALVAETNNLLNLVEQKSQRAEEMAGIIDQREQENQLLWLEIEHNLCLAKEEAERDGLTNLYNRKSIEERFAIEIEKASQQGYPLSVLMADLDHFKQVNDTYGHKTGDEVLKIFADTLQKTTRSNDIPARYGGEEFLVVLPETPIEYAINIAKRINFEFAKAVEQKLGTAITGLRCTVSIGIADYPICAPDKNKLVSAADLALYKAKENGRNCVVYYGEIRAMKQKPA